jgi:hypothetical protein
MCQKLSKKWKQSLKEKTFFSGTKKLNRYGKAFILKQSLSPYENPYQLSAWALQSLRPILSTFPHLSFLLFCWLCFATLLSPL